MLTAPAASSAASLAGASTRAGPMVGTAATAAATAITPHTFGRGLMLAEASVGFAASTSLKGSSKHYPIVQHSLVSWLNRRDMSLSIMRAAALQFSPKLQQWSDEVKVRRSARAGGGGGGGGASPHTPVASRCRADGSRTLRCDGMPCHRRTHSSRAPSPLSLSLARSCTLAPRPCRAEADRGGRGERHGAAAPAPLPRRDCHSSRCHQGRPARVDDGHAAPCVRARRGEDPQAGAGVEADKGAGSCALRRRRHRGASSVRD